MALLMIVVFIGKDLFEVQQDVLKIIEGRILVGHSIKHDLDVSRSFICYNNFITGCSLFITIFFL